METERKVAVKDDALINDVINMIAGLVNDKPEMHAFWKNHTKGTDAMPGGMKEIQKEVNTYKKNEYNFISNKVELLSAIGKIIAAKKRDLPLFGGLLEFKDKQFRDDFTVKLYAILSKLTAIDDIKNDSEFNKLLTEIRNELRTLLTEEMQKQPQHYAAFNFFAKEKQNLELLQKLGIQTGKKVYYLYSDSPTDQLFANGIHKNSNKRALRGQGYVDTADLPTSMYIVVDDNTNASLEKKYKYMYVIDCPAAIATDSFTNHNHPDIKGKSLIPRAIEPREIVGCCTTADRRVFKNDYYQEPYSLTQNGQLLFRGDSRSYSDKDTQKGIFSQGLFPLGLVSDNALNWSNQQEPTIFVSTTEDISRTLKFPETLNKGETRYVYVIYKPDRTLNSKDISDLAENIHSLTDKEFFVPGGIPSSYILGAYTYKDGVFEKFTFNPQSAVKGYEQDETFFSKFNLPKPKEIESGLSFGLVQKKN